MGKMNAAQRAKRDASIQYTRISDTPKQELIITENWT